MTEPDFQLTDLEIQSAVWQKVSAYLEDRLQVTREKNDNPCDEATTAATRGKIDAYKKLLAIGKPLTGMQTGD